MCLTSKTNVPRIAYRDIDVYKIIEVKSYMKRINQNHHYIYNHIFEMKTPYRGIKIPTLPYKLIAEGKERITERFSSREYMIDRGFIHAYRYPMDACDYCDRYYSNNNVIIKGIIPANTMYFIGEDCDICAKEIRLQGILYYNNNAFKEIIKYFPNIPIFNFKIILEQMNLSINEEIKEEKLEEELVYV